jgi:hypothetical protein
MRDVGDAGRPSLGHSQPVCPDHVVVIGAGHGLAILLAPVPQERVHRLPPSPSAQRKSPAARVRNRQSALRAALTSCGAVSLPTVVVEDLHPAAPKPDRFRLCGLAGSNGEIRALDQSRPGYDPAFQGGQDLARSGGVAPILHPACLSSANGLQPSGVRLQAAINLISGIAMPGLHQPAGRDRTAISDPRPNQRIDEVPDFGGAVLEVRDLFRQA